MDDDSSDGSIGSPTSPPPSIHGDGIVGRLRSSPSLTSFEDTDPKRKKHNFAVFGSKLTNSAVAKYNKKKEQPPSSLSLFRSSKTDLKSLRMKTDLGIQTSINAARSSINDRSPMARTSKELDRIANLGSPGTLIGTPILEPPATSKRHHMFHKKNSPQTVLSSSASNSRLGSEGSVYSFQQAPSLQLEKSFKSLEECQQTMDYTWSLLYSRTQQIFSEMVLRIPVEDINTLVTVHFGAHVSSGGTALEMIDRVSELLVSGFKSSRKPQSGNVLERWTGIWRQFFTQTLLMLEAVFLPLQLEIEGSGGVLEEKGFDYWLPINKLGTLSIRRCILIAFRDSVLIPEIDNIKRAMNSLEVNQGTAQIAASLNQCVNVITLIQSDDASQAKIDSLASALRQSWMSRPRIAKDRRGLVMRRSIGRRMSVDS